MKNKFWKWLCVFAYKQIKADSDCIKVGVPGIRDRDNECTIYMPGKFKDDWRGHCEGDGHYLCKECRFFKRED